MQLSQSIGNDEKLIEILKGNGVAVMPTDTIYGLVGKALDENVVNRIYKIRKRNPEKPCIILIGEIDELNKFSIALSAEQKEKLKEFWSISAMADIDPVEPVSIILDCPDEKFSYLHRGTKTLAFRIPQPEDLRNLLLQMGPLIAPSANLEGLLPAQSIFEAKKYFGNLVDLYVDGGDIIGKASKIVKLNKNGTVTIIRE